MPDYLGQYERWAQDHPLTCSACFLVCAAVVAGALLALVAVLNG